MSNTLYEIPTGSCVQLIGRFHRGFMKKNVLIVEDDENLRSLLVDILKQKLSLNVAEASCADEGHKTTGWLCPKA